MEFIPAGPSSDRDGQGTVQKLTQETDLVLPSTCLVCMQQLTLLTQNHLQPCGHTFCSQCIHDHLDSKVSAREVRNLTCPAFNCMTRFTEAQLKHRLGEEKYAKYCRFKQESELEADPDLRWCPRPACKGYDYCRGLKRKLICSQCEFQFCRYCLSAWHGRAKCSAEIDHQFEKWAHGARVKFCPQCRMRVEKNLGCPHMTCVRCSYEWCWACGAPYSGHYPCPVLNPHWANQPWSRCFLALFLPLLFLLIFVFAVLNSIKSFLLDSSVSRSLRLSVFLLATLTSLLLTPLGFAFALPLSGIAFLLICYEKCGCDGSCFMVFFLLLASLPLGLCLSPIVVAVVLFIVAMGPPVGVTMVLLKLIVALVRCGKKDFLKAKGIPGYPLG